MQEWSMEEVFINRVVLRSGAKNYGIAKAACDKNRNIAKKRKIYCK